MADMTKFDIENILKRINGIEMPKAKEGVVAKATAPKAKTRADVLKATAKETNLKQKDVAEKLKKVSKDDSVVRALTTLPAMDCNYTTDLNKATKEQLEKAIKIMEKGEGNKTRIKRCKDKLKSLNNPNRKKNVKAAAEVKTEAKEQPKEEKKKALIIQFPTKKPEFEVLDPTNEGHTYEECEAKLNKEREIFKDNDSQFVIDGLLAKCKEDANFRDNVMREDKTFAGAFEYFFNLAKQGFAIKINNNMAYLDNEMALEYSINYFNKK